MPELVPLTVSRLLSIVAWIHEHPGVPVAELAAHFSRTNRQIRRDIEALGSVGDSLPGASFEIDWDLLENEDRLRIRSTLGVDLPPRLTGREAAAILVGLDALAPNLDEELRSRIPRTALAVRALVGEEGEDPALVHSDPDEPTGILDVLADAIRDDRPVAFEYRSADGRRSARVVEPWDVRRGGAGWILRGWCLGSRGERNFAVDRMSGVEIAAGSIAHRPMAPRRDWPVERIVVDARGRWVADDFESVDARELGDDGGVELAVPVWNEEWFASLLIDLAPSLRGAAPGPRARAGERAARMLEAWTKGAE